MRVMPSVLSDLPLILRPLFWRQRRRYGAPLTPALVWARVPRLYGALLAFYAAIERRSSPLPPLLRALVQVRVSQLNHCAFCMDLNASIAAERAGSMDKAIAVDRWREHDGFDAGERLALEYAEAMSQTGCLVDDDLSQRLRKQFDEPTLIELTALIAFQNMSARFNAALDIAPQGLCRLPDQA